MGWTIYRQYSVIISNHMLCAGSDTKREGSTQFSNLFWDINVIFNNINDFFQYNARNKIDQHNANVNDYRYDSEQQYEQYIIRAE